MHAFNMIGNYPNILLIQCVNNSFFNSWNIQNKSEYKMRMNVFYLWNQNLWQNNNTGSLKNIFVHFLTFIQLFTILYNFLHFVHDFFFISLINITYFFSSILYVFTFLHSAWTNNSFENIILLFLKLISKQTLSGFSHDLSIS